MSLDVPGREGADYVHLYLVLPRPFECGLHQRRAGSGALHLRGNFRVDQLKHFPSQGVLEPGYLPVCFDLKATARNDGWTRRRAENLHRNRLRETRVITVSTALRMLLTGSSDTDCNQLDVKLHAAKDAVGLLDGFWSIAAIDRK